MQKNNSGEAQPLKKKGEKKRKKRGGERRKKKRKKNQFSNVSKWFRKLVPIIWLIIWRLPITPIATAQKKTNRSTSSNTLCCHGYHGRSGRTISGLQDGQASSASPLFRSLQNIRTSGVCVSEGPRRRKGRRGGGSGHNQQ